MTLLSMVRAARDAGGSGAMLIASLADARGVDCDRVMAGQMRLADMLVERADDGAASVAIRAIGEDLLARALTGEMSPGDALSERIARVTDGKVLPHHWAENCEPPEGFTLSPTAQAAAPVPPEGAAADPVPRITAGRRHAVIDFGVVRVSVAKAHIASVIAGLQRVEPRLA